MPPSLTAFTDHGRVLIVDDDEALLEMLSEGLRLRDFEVYTAASGREALEIVQSTELDAVVSDLQMDGMSGLELSERLSDIVEVPVILLTGRGSLETAIDAIRLGVYDFLQKPVKLDVLELALSRAIERRRLGEEVKRLRETDIEDDEFADMVGESRPMRQLQSLVERVAPAQVSVLITGESGTGKELVARAIHRRSACGEGPFVAINCAAMPASLLESELFGHAKGAFTDAKESKTGLFKQADGGTLFLDEIGDMPLEMQAKLLRALQEQKVRPVGGDAEIEFDVRVIAATNRDLEEDVEGGRFREDLFYRINVVHIPVPPLRERGRDVLHLAQHFVRVAAEKTGADVRGLSQSATAKILSYDWPGNVRELENCMQRGVALARHSEISLEDLPEKVRSFEPTETEPEALGGQLITIQELERRHIIRVLKAVDNNKTQAAKTLGFDRRTLYRKLERYGIDA